MAGPGIGPGNDHLVLLFFKNLLAASNVLTFACKLARFASTLAFLLSSAAFRASKPVSALDAGFDDAACCFGIEVGVRARPLRLLELESFVEGVAASLCWVLALGLMTPDELRGGFLRSRFVSAPLSVPIVGFWPALPAGAEFGFIEILGAFFRLFNLTASGSARLTCSKWSFCSSSWIVRSCFFDLPRMSRTA